MIENRDHQEPGQHFNGLTPAQAERLAMLAEECGEVIQAVGKILRHGYESSSPFDLHIPPVTNRENLRKEVTDVLASIQLMTCQDSQSEDFEMPNGTEVSDARVKKLRYTHHQ